MRKDGDGAVSLVEASGKKKTTGKATFKGTSEERN